MQATVAIAASVLGEMFCLELELGKRFFNRAESF
jgi:hypothetical protein